MAADRITRRDLVKALGAVPLISGAGRLAYGEAVTRSTNRGHTSARVGVIGVGRRGTSLLRTLLTLGNVTVPALADIDAAHAERGAQLVRERRGTTPALHTDGPEDFRRMVTREDLDAVIIATPWEWHTRMSVAAMKAGKLVGVEAPAGLTVDDCWELVRTSESTGVWCMQLENVCYFRDLMQILNMVRAGQLGELIHCSGAYRHDARAGTFDKDGNIGPTEWWAQYELEHDGNPSPYHPIGPIAQCLNIGRGDRFDYLVSVSSKARGLNKWVADHYGPDRPNAKKKFALGDVNTTVIKSVNGALITLYFDVNSPRPYDLGMRIQGTRGIYEMKREGPDTQKEGAIYIEGRSPTDQWESLEKYRGEYDHPLWRKLEAQANKAGGHGGADYVEMYRFVDCIIKGATPEQDVYDAADWSVIIPLSEKSAVSGGAPVAFPDFTAGKWKARAPVPIIEA